MSPSIDVDFCYLAFSIFSSQYGVTSRALLPNTNPPSLAEMYYPINFGTLVFLLTNQRFSFIFMPAQIDVCSSNLLDFQKVFLLCSQVPS